MKKYTKNLILSLFILATYFIQSNSVLAAIPDMQSITSSPDSDQVLLSGLINPNGDETTAWFEYGSSSNLTNSNESLHSYVGSSVYAFPFEQTLTKFLPDTTYYYRLVTNNIQGTAKSSILHFTTKKAIVVVTVGSNNPATTLNSNNNSNTGLEANPFIGSSFLPSTLIGWLAIILIILGLILVSRQLYIKVPAKTQTKETP